jgi:hypothetical protein
VCDIQLNIFKQLCYLKRDIQNAIDLDQIMIEDLVSESTDESFAQAAAVYAEGAHSKSYAELTLLSALPYPVTTETEITATNIAGDTITGYPYEAADTGAMTLLFQYPTLSNETAPCHVGASVEPNLFGCLVREGQVLIGNTSLYYTYKPAVDNNNGRTIQGFSTNANTTMRVNGNGTFYEDFQKFYDYYGSATYADEFVTSALTGTSTNLTLGNADFAPYGYESRAGKFLYACSSCVYVCAFRFRSISKAYVI